MEDNERNKALDEFYTEYMRMKPKYGLNMSSKIDISGKCVAEVYWMDGEQKCCIFKLSEDLDDGTVLYIKALDHLRDFENRQKENGCERTA